MGIAQGMRAIRIAEIGFPMIVDRPSGKAGQNPGVRHGRVPALRMHRIVGQPLGGGHMQPLEFSPDPQARLIEPHHRGLTELRLNRRRRRRDRRRAFLAGFQQRRFRDPVIQQVLEDLRGAFDRHEMLGLEIGRPGLDARTVLHDPGHPDRKYPPVFGPTARTGFHFRPVRRDLDPDRGNIEHLPFFMGRDRGVRQARATLGARHDRMQFRVIGYRDPFQGLPQMPRLTAVRLLTRLAQTGGALGLRVAIAGRRFTAVIARFGQAGLHVFQRRRLRLQLPSQSLDLSTHLCKEFHYRFLPLPEGAMDLVTGRESQVHGVRINTRVTLGNPAGSGSATMASTGYQRTAR